MIFLPFISYLTIVFVRTSYGNEESISKSSTYSEGCYWRDYMGVIPKDAFPAGLDNTGNITYIGQVLHGDLLIPGEISGTEQKIFYELFQLEYIATKNIKILCVHNTNQLEWVPVCHNRSRDLLNFNLVKGGQEASTNVYIGRINISVTGQTAAGKVCLNDDYGELRISPCKGREFKFSAFDVLCYDSNKIAQKEVSVKSFESCPREDKTVNEFATSIDTETTPKVPDKLFKVDIKISADQLALVVASVCVMQYLIIVIFGCMIYILICMIGQFRTITYF